MNLVLAYVALQLLSVSQLFVWMNDLELPRLFDIYIYMYIYVCKYIYIYIICIYIYTHTHTYIYIHERYTIV